MDVINILNCLGANFSFSLAGMNHELHPLSDPLSTVKQLGRETLSPEQFKLARPDIRSVELDAHIADGMAMELPEQKRIVPQSTAAGLPEIQVSAYEGHVLSLLLKMMGAKRGVEVGTLGGYSTSWICRALEDQTGAHLDSLELSPKYAQVARENLSRWQSLVEIHTGPALDTLNGKLAHLRDLDFVFIDADKANYPHYFDWGWQRLKVGGAILLDNFYLWGGVYFRGEKFPQRYADGMAGDMLTEPKWRAMKSLWTRLESLGEAADKTILSTSEGLGVVRKRK